MLGHRIPGIDVLSLLSGDVRPEMVDLLDRVKAAGYATACLTNNVLSDGTPEARRAAIDRARAMRAETGAS